VELDVDGGCGHGQPFEGVDPRDVSAPVLDERFQGALPVGQQVAHLLRSGVKDDGGPMARCVKGVVEILRRSIGRQVSDPVILVGEFDVCDAVEAEGAPVVAVDVPPARPDDRCKPNRYLNTTFEKRFGQPASATSRSRASSGCSPGYARTSCPRMHAALSPLRRRPRRLGPMNTFDVQPDPPRSAVRSDWPRYPFDLWA